MVWKQLRLPARQALSEAPLKPLHRPVQQQLSRWGRPALGLALLLVLSGDIQSQTTGQRQSPKWGPPDAKTDRIDENLPMGDGSDSSGFRLLRMLNAARQKSMVTDAAKLLKLARQLDAEVAAANGDSFTPEQLRKIARIEKLARNVKEEMSSSVRDAVMSTDPFSPIQP